MPAILRAAILVSGMVLSLGLTIPPAQAGCVVGVSSGNQLNVRSGPAKRFAIVGGIPADACGVRIRRKCIRGWCRVRYGEVVGWASLGFLRRGSGPAPGTALKWELLGKRKVDFRADRDIIRIGRSDGRFRAIQLLVRNNDLLVQRLRVTYGNGRVQDINTRVLIKAGRRSRVIDLIGRDRFIRHIEIVYQSHPNTSKQALVEIYGVRAVKKLASAERPRTAKPALTWELLGSKSVQFSLDRDIVKIGRAEGPFRAIQILVRNDDVFFYDLKIVYGNDRVQDVPVRALIKSGQRTRIIDLLGNTRRLREVRLLYRSRLGSTARAIVEVYGLRDVR